MTSRVVTLASVTPPRNRRMYYRGGEARRVAENCSLKGNAVTSPRESDTVVLGRGRDRGGRSGLGRRERVAGGILESLPARRLRRSAAGGPGSVVGPARATPVGPPGHLYSADAGGPLPRRLVVRAVVQTTDVAAN